MPLTCCPGCSSRLIGLAGCEGVDEADDWSQLAVVDRRCPECDYRDRQITTALAAAIWTREELRVAETLLALADALADGMVLDLSELLVQ